MKTKYLIIFIVISLVVFGVVNNIFGQESSGETGIQYPVAELGNCADRGACEVYCDNPENTEACLVFAEKNKLMSEEEIEIAKKFIEAGSNGPGGCATKNSCETYCNDMNHIDECISFAEENNLMQPEELAEAKKVQAAIARGVNPPPCGNKKQCDVYCEEPDHMEVCITFAAEAGFLQGKELEDAQKMLLAIKKGVTPPPCRGKEACDEYCNNPDNMEVCMNFAIEAGFMDEQEKVNAQKMLQAIKGGVRPPDCQGKEECDAYCGQEEHFEECINFAVAAGFMSAEDVVMARKTGGKGPGDCKGKEECEAFCNNPDNQETCFNFAKEHGLIPEEDLKQMEEGKQKMQESLQQAPSAVLDCLGSEMGFDTVEKLKAGEAMPSREIGEKMRICFEKSGPQNGPGNNEMAPPSRQTGPGGCTNPEECKIYCEANPGECQNFQPGPGEINPGGQMMPQQAGPGGCKSPEECRNYCEANPGECGNSGNGGGEQFAPGTGPSPSNQENGFILPENKQTGEFSPTGPGGCQTPEECQQRQNQIMPQNICEGENCQPIPLPGEFLQPPFEENSLPIQPENSIDYQQQINQPMPPVYQQPPVEQQLLPEDFSQPSGFNSTSLLGLILQAFLPFLKF